MICKECELALANEQRSPVVETQVAMHVAGCAACREFAMELLQNAEALGSFSLEAMPSMPALSRTTREVTPRRQQVAWWAGVAAMLILGFVSSWAISKTGFVWSRQVLRASQVPARSSPHVPLVSEPASQITPVASVKQAVVTGPVKHRPAMRSPRGNEPGILQIKMLTDDPDVVIYWQVEN